MAIAVNIVTGFLGVGKTTSIINLINRNQSNERWAVLVNEFGTVGIDGAMLQSQTSDQRLAVKEIPGGCLCCTAGLPFQIGLNQLISQQRPDRLIIEPTGLGHLSEIIKSLQAEYYQDVLQLKSVICLVDPVNLSDSRYTEHEVFQDQLKQADVILANKVDQSKTDDLMKFDQLIEQLQPAVSAKVEQGLIEAQWLDLPHQMFAVSPEQQTAQPADHKHTHHNTSALPGAFLTDGEDCQRFEGNSQGYFSCGWIVTQAAIFDEVKLTDWIHAQQVERIKGVLRTAQGWRIVNMRSDVVTITSIDEAADSRLEMIYLDNGDLGLDSAEQSLLSCIVRLS